MAGDEVQRRQQLGHPRDSATEHGRGRYGCLRAHGIVLSMMVCSDTSCGGCGHDDDITGGVEFSAKIGLWPRGQKRPGEKEETTRGLTVVTLGWPACSGKRRRRRIDRRSSASRCGGDELEDDGMVILGLHGLARRKRGTRQSSGAHRRGSKMAVAVGELIGGNGCVRSRA